MPLPCQGKPFAPSIGQQASITLQQLAAGSLHRQTCQTVGGIEPPDELTTSFTEYNAARTFLPARTPASQLSTLPWLSECDRRARRRARHCGSFQRPSFRVNYSRLLTGKKIVKRNAPAMRRYLTLRRPAYCEEPLTLLSENGQSLIFQPLMLSRTSMPEITGIG